MPESSKIMCNFNAIMEVDGVNFDTEENSNRCFKTWLNVDEVWWQGEYINDI